MRFVSYAQNWEDVMLWRALGHVGQGFYVDVGAFSPDEHSVTRAFYDLGWSGINIEPNPQRIAELKAKRTRDINLGVAASSTEGTVQLHVVADTGLTTAEPSIAERHKASGWDVSVIEVPRRSLSGILDEYLVLGQPIHFLKIDVEGHEAQTIRGIDLSRHRPWVIVVEATAPLSQLETTADWEPVLLAAGYRCVYWDGLNRFYLADEHAGLATAFSAPPNVFDDFVTSEFTEARAEAAKASGRAQDLEHQADNLETLLEQEKQSCIQAASRAHDMEQQAHNLETLLEQEKQSSMQTASWTQDMERQLHSLQALLEREKHRADLAESAVARASGQVHYMSHRPFWENLLFRQSGRPKKAVRRLLFHSSGKPRGIFKNLVLHPDGRPHKPFMMWLSSSEYQGLPKAVRMPDSLLSGGAAAAFGIHPNSTPMLSVVVQSHFIGQQATATAFGGPGTPVLSFFLEIGPTSSGAEVQSTLLSLFAQSRLGWEVVLYGAGALQFSESWSASGKMGDSRIVVASPADGAASALILAKGEFVAVLRPGDVLEMDALEQIAGVLARSPEAEILYCDEDVLNEQGSPEKTYLKPSWSPELLYAFNYFGRLAVLQRVLVQRVGGFRDAADMDWEWDLNLRASDTAQAILRVPKVLCHRQSDREQGRSAAGTAASDAAKRTIEAYWRGKGFDATARTMPDGTQSVTWPFVIEPRVSIIIPTKDKPDLLRVSVRGVLERTDYRNLDLIIVDTGSTEAATHALYKELRRDPRVRILNFKTKFNYSSACNFGAQAAGGSLLLFLNNDVEVISPDWLAEMVRVAQHPGVGCVGVKLTFPTGQLQHAGVMIGPHLAALGYRGAEKMEFGIFGSPHHPRNWLAIMGACQMVSRAAFSAVGGFDEAYQIAMSDIALCIQLWRAGYRTAYVPAGELVHHEGASRGHSNPAADERRLGDDIRAAGIHEDPYLHPELTGNDPTPRRRTGSDPGPADALRDMLALKGSYPTAHAYLDLSNEGEVAQFIGRTRDEILWTPQPAFKVNGAQSLARFVLDLLRRRPDIRAQFPRALSDGADGKFGRWLSSGAIAQFGLPTETAAYVQEMYDADFGGKARRRYFWRDDVRTRFPLGLTPPGRDELLGWFFQYGRYEAPLSQEACWWLFIEAAERPEQELVTAFAFTPEWQAMFPDGASPFGADRFAQWFAASYRVSGPWIQPSRWQLPGTAADQLRLSWQTREDWRARHPHALADEASARAFIAWLGSGSIHLEPWVAAWLASLDPSQVAKDFVRVGLNVIGHFRYPSGLRVSAEAIVDGLHQCGVQTSLRDLRTDQRDDAGHEQFSGFETFDVTLIHTQPEPFFAIAHHKSDLYERVPRPYRIAYWYWEFDTIPDKWQIAAETVDEVWTATEFVATGLRQKLRVPVRTLFPGVQLATFAKRGRAYFGLSDDETVFLFAFHMASVMERKNPLGLIRAFKLAFGPEEPVRLVLKTTFGASHPVQIAELQAAASGARITIIDGEFPHQDVLALMETSDAYVSLHRSEGLGLTMAEAMLMGKPVIATRYSGNLEFMDDGNSLLVDFKLVKVGRPIPPYDASYHWAEPSEMDAAAKMRKLVDDKDFARNLGARAMTDAQSRLSVAQAGNRIASRLAEIRKAQGGTGSG